MPELPLADVEVGAVDDRFVAELPMRARLDGCPFFHDESNGLAPAGMFCSSAMTRGIIDWMFRNRTTGEITVVQAPNLVLTIFLIATAAGFAFPHPDTVHAGLDLVAMGSLLWWAVDELTRGVNPFRRFLGAGAVLYEASRVLLS